MFQTQVGELIVGSYLRVLNDCELVSYNQRSRDTGHQTVVDVLGVESSSKEQTVHACEVVTHIGGLLYSGQPHTDRWSDFGGVGYQNTLERLWDKFDRDYNLVREVFDDADEYVLQLWSPVVPRGKLTDGLAELQTQFEAEHDVEIELVINGEYKSRVNEIRQRASETTESYDEPAFRFFQILEHLRDD